MVNIINVGYHSTNYYAIELNSGKLLVDCGWPGTLPAFTAELKRKGIAPGDIQYLLVTHFHPDHAGLAGEFKKLGARLILLENQVDFVAPLNASLRAKVIHYGEIRTDDNLLLKFRESREFLRRLGLAGEVIATPGHSEDSVTLVLDEGFAFTGDLPPLQIVAEEDLVTRESWNKIYTHRITRIFPAHGS